MTKKEKLVWRLGKLPSVDELRGLVADKVITQEEAREILFSLETQEDRDEDSLKSEIKFLRELVEKLSNNQTNTITTIREIEQPYRGYPWYVAYDTWCGNNDTSTYTTSTGISSMTATEVQSYVGGTVAFSDINTF